MSAIAAPNMKRVGLALGGGIVRGLTHLGVLSVLVEAGIHIDCVAGTSVGAIVAAAFCKGLSIAEIESLAATFHWRRILSPTWPTQGLVSLHRIEQWMAESLGQLDFNDLKIPCTVVATDLKAGRPVNLSNGPLIPAIHASCAVPGFVKPVKIDGRLLGDGAVTNMLPVSVCREMGADYVIGVDIMAFSIRRFLGPIGYLWGAIEILLKGSGCGARLADCLIQPKLERKTYLRLSKRQELYALGRQAAVDCLDVIRRDLGIERPLE